jgi:ketosteroid isomerase-like protein
VAHPNEGLVRKGFAAFQGGDMATLSELLADDVVWHAAGRSQLSGDFHGKEAVFGTFQKAFELTGGSLKLEIHDMLANDTHVVALVHAEAEHEGKKLDDNGVQVFHVSNGKVTEQWLQPGDVYASDEFWGQG